MHVYECPECGFIVKSEELFLSPKPCLNCDDVVFLVLQESADKKDE